MELYIEEANKRFKQAQIDCKYRDCVFQSFLFSFLKVPNDDEIDSISYKIKHIDFKYTFAGYFEKNDDL
jgi:hypothetical protein